MRGGTAYDRDGREVVRTAVRTVNRPDGGNVGAVIVDGQGRVVENYVLTEVTRAEADSVCQGPAPEAWQYAPTLTLTFMVDFGL